MHFTDKNVLFYLQGLQRIFSKNVFRNICQIVFYQRPAKCVIMTLKGQTGKTSCTAK